MLSDQCIFYYVKILIKNYEYNKWHVNSILVQYSYIVRAAAMRLRCSCNAAACSCGYNENALRVLVYS